VFRRLFTLAVAAAVLAVLAEAALAVNVRVRVEGRTTTLFGSAEPTLSTSGVNVISALDAASVRGEFYYHVTRFSFGLFVDQIGRYPGEGSNGWSFKVNGVSPQVGADQTILRDRDVVLWYWNTFSSAGGSPTLVLRKRSRNCYTVLSQNDAGVTSPAAGATLLVGSRRVSTRAGRACVGRHTGLVRAVKAGAVRSNALP
jgi:Domain of unknown function (DUF4430)